VFYNMKLSEYGYNKGRNYSFKFLFLQVVSESAPTTLRLVTGPGSMHNHSSNA
jgi:hypothetical protein